MRKAPHASQFESDVPSMFELPFLDGRKAVVLPLGVTKIHQTTEVELGLSRIVRISNDPLLLSIFNNGITWHTVGDVVLYLLPRLFGSRGCSCSVARTS